MVLGRVVGTVVSTAKTENLNGVPLLLVESVAVPSMEGKGQFVVAFDAVGANRGEVVFYVTGSSARMTPASKGKPSDATITAIVDAIEHGGEAVYRKEGSKE